MKATNCWNNLLEESSEFSIHECLELIVCLKIRLESDTKLEYNVEKEQWRDEM